MTREARFFQRALLISVVLHVVLLVLFVTLPGGGPAEPVQIYTVRIMEAPARPEVRELQLSTDVISALKLESPSLSTDAPPLPEPESPDVPAVERFPGEPPQPQTRAPAEPALTPPSSETGPPDLRPPPAAPQAPASSTRPLPGLPAAPPVRPPPSAAPAQRTPAPPPPPPGALPPDEDVSRPTAMEQLRSKVRQLNLEVETAPAQQPSNVPAPSRERNVLSLRMYSNRVREAVKEQYTFPGGFDAALRARVRVVLNRDGSVRSTELLESSGNERFDRLVCLAAFNKARIPAIPEGLDTGGETLTLLFTCSP